MWNEELLLPYFLRHYETFADRIFIINDHSTDRTVAIAKSHPKVHVINFAYSGGLIEQNFNTTFESLSRQFSRGQADWVMCVDADEFIYNPDILKELAMQKKRRRKVLKTTAYTMMSETLPTTSGQIYEELNQGLRSRGFDKEIIFDPEFDIVFGDGRHKAKLPQGMHATKAKMTLLHYRYLSREYFIERSKKAFARMRMDARMQQYRINRGLKLFDSLKIELKKVL